MMSVFGTIKAFLSDHKLKISKVLLIVFGTFLVVCFSGIGYVGFQMSSRTKAILYIMLFLYFFLYFVFSLKVDYFKKIVVRKRIPIPSPFTCIFVLMASLLLLSFIFNKNKTLNINTYISFFITISISFFILRTFKVINILKIFKNVLFFVSICSLILFVFTFVSKTFFSSIFYSNESIIFGTHLFLENEPISGLTYSYFWRLRLSGIFWEPSVFGVFLIAGLICDLYSRDKMSLVRFFTFVICIIFTQSTSAYILFVFYLVLVISELLKGKKRLIAFIVSFVILILALIFSNQIISLLAKILPNVFGKFIYTSSSTSFTTRLFSFSNYFKVFLKNPIFGVGGVTAANEYYLISNGFVTAETSTFGSCIAAFGICGFLYFGAIIFGILLNKKLSVLSKITIIALVFLGSNAQNQSAIIALNLLYFIPLLNVFVPTKVNKYNEQFAASLSSKNLFELLIKKGENNDVSRNIFYSFILKGISIILAFITIPIYLYYFDYNDSFYGIWLSITSILSIITIFDFGMGNGLKNELVKNITTNNHTKTKTYVSTIYFITAISGILIFSVSLILILSLKDSILSSVFFREIDATKNDLLFFRIGASIIILSVATQFVFKNINYVLQAHQRNAITGIFPLITNCVLLLSCIVFSKLIPSSSKIVILSLIYFLALNLPLLLASIILYRKKYKLFKPSLSAISIKDSKKVINRSIKFFIVQIGILFLWSINEFIILFNFGYKSSLVTEYSEYYKLLSLIPTIIGTVIQQPFWTAISRAKHERNNRQLKRLFLSLFLIIVLSVIMNIVVVFLLPSLFNVWLGTSAPKVSFGKQIVFIIYSIVYIVSLGFIIVCNAFSIFKTQIAMALLGIFAKIPLIVFVKYLFKDNVGWEIVVITNMICYLPVFIFAFLEIKRYLEKNRINISKDNKLSDDALFYEVSI